VRADGGYAIWWPSSGYPVLNDMPLDQLPPWPDWIVVAPPAVRPPRADRPIRIPDRYQLERLVNFVLESREEDHDRNNRLHWAACRMGELIFPSMLSEDEAIELLLPAAISVGLERKKALASICSGLRKGQE